MPDIFQRIAVHALYATVLNFIHEYNIFSNILHIDIALSGGADSVGLAALLAAYRHQSGANVSLRTHHIRHGLRNDAYDSEIARTTAEKLALPHIETLLNLGDVACNVEAVARSARYEAFFGALANEQNAALALAHHGDENVETAIWRLYGELHARLRAYPIQCLPSVYKRFYKAYSPSEHQRYSSLR